MTIRVRHATQVSQPNNPDRAVSATVWNEDHELIGLPLRIDDFDTCAEAIQYAATNNRALHVPAGVWDIASTVTITDKGLTIRGEGRDISVLRFATGGLVINSTVDTDVIDIQDVKFITQEEGVSTALAVTKDVPSTGYRDKQFMLRNVVFGGETLDTEWFDKCVSLDTVRGVLIDNCNFFGRFASPSIATTAVQLRGQCIGVYVQNCRGLGFTNFVEALGSSEGVVISDNEASLVLNGVLIDGDGGQPPLQWIIDNHFNTRDKAVHLIDCSQVRVDGNLFYGDEPGGGFGTGAGYDCITIEHTGGAAKTDFDVTDNQCFDLTAATGRGLVTIGTIARLRASLNEFQNFQTGMEIGSGASSCEFVFNSFPNTTTDVTNAGSNCIRIERGASTGEIYVYEDATLISTLGATREDLYRYVDNTNPRTLALRKARGTQASKAIVQASDGVGRIDFDAWDGGAWVTGGRIESSVGDTPGSGDMPTDLSFQVVANGSTTLVERLGLRNTGAAVFRPPSGAQTLTTNGEVTFELTNNTTLTFRARGSDGTTRTGTVTLA